MKTPLLRHANLQLLIFAAVGQLCLSRAPAAVITFDFTGHVTSNRANAYGITAGVGTDVAGSFSYDTEVPPNPNPYGYPSAVYAESAPPANYSVRFLATGDTVALPGPIQFLVAAEVPYYPGGPSSPAQFLISTYFPDGLWHNSTVLVNGLPQPQGIGFGRLDLTERNRDGLFADFRLPTALNAAALDMFGVFGLPYENDANAFGIHFAIDELTLRGSSQSNPILPAAGPPWFFPRANSGAWFDPLPTGGFLLETTSDSLFTHILDFPTGFASPFDVSVDGSLLGAFGPGQDVDFTSFPGGGVSRFSITGIDPNVDGDDPLAFPIKLSFNTLSADFTMTPLTVGASAVPAPSALLIWGMGIVGLAACRTRAKQGGKSVC